MSTITETKNILKRKRSSGFSPADASHTGSEVKKKKNVEESNTTKFIHFIRNLPKRDDYTVAYFFVPDADVHVRHQADRDYIAKVMAFYSPRGKRDSTLTPTQVTANLAADIQGITTDRDENSGMTMVFKSAKHIAGAVSYIRETAVDHHDVQIRMRVDNSKYFNVY